MITYIYDYISKNKCIKCMILMHEMHVISAVVKELGEFFWNLDIFDSNNSDFFIYFLIFTCIHIILSNLK